MSSPVSDADGERIKERMKSILESFAVNMAKEYAIAVVDEVKAESAEKAKTPRRLLEAGDADFVIYEGSVSKEGDPGLMFSSWKDRHLVALNANDNYKVEYYDAPGGKRHGEINCCGYYTRTLNKEEKEKFGGEYGIVLVPYQSSRRTWHIKCETEDDQNQWKQVFTQACRKAGPPEHENPVIAASFKAAFMATAYENGVSGIRVQYSEAECLAMFIYDIIYDEVLRDCFAIVPEDQMFRDKMIDTAKAFIRSTLMAGANATWTAASAAAAKTTDGVMESARGSLGPLADAEVKMMKLVKTAAQKAIGKPITNCIKDNCSGVLKVLADRVSVAMMEAIRGFNTMAKEMEADLVAASENESERGEIFVKMNRMVNWHYSGPLTKSYEATSELVGETRDDVFVENANSLNAFDISHRASDFVQVFYADMVATLADHLGNKVSAADAIAKTTGAACGDLTSVVNKCVTTVVSELLTGADMWKALVDEPMTNAMEPLKASFEALPDPISSFIDADKYKSDAIAATLEGLLTPLIEGETKKRLSKDALVKELKADKASAK